MCGAGPDLLPAIREDKSASTFRALMEGYTGTVVCDALKTHEAGARGNDAMGLAGCWAQFYRKFEEAAPHLRPTSP